jgi:phage/plasmid-associated DNA primase
LNSSIAAEREALKADIRKKIKKTLKQICNNDKEDLEFVLSFLGYSITSETKEQKFLNLYGPLASNGKSTLIKMMNSVFGIYIQPRLIEEHLMIVIPNRIRTLHA